MKKTLSILAAMMLFLFSTSCNSENNPNAVPPDAIYAMVTFMGNTESGSEFEYQENNLSQPVTLLYKGTVDTNVFPKGCRLLIVFTYQSTSTADGGWIDIYQVAKAYNAGLEYGTSASTDGWKTSPLSMLGMWLTGDYLNVNCSLNINNKFNKYTLVADEATLDTEMPSLYLLFEPDMAGLIRPSQMFASFNIGSLWEREGVKGFTVDFYSQEWNSHRTLRFKRDSKGEFEMDVLQN